jgi:hypothetical protein
MFPECFLVKVIKLNLLSVLFLFSRFSSPDSIFSIFDFTSVITRKRRSFILFSRLHSPFSILDSDPWFFFLRSRSSIPGYIYVTPAPASSHTVLHICHAHQHLRRLTPCYIYVTPAPASSHTVLRVCHTTTTAPASSHSVRRRRYWCDIYVT